MPSPGVWAGIGSALAVIAGLITSALGHETITLWMNKIQAFFSPYVQTTIPEHGAGRIGRSDFYAAIEAYLYERCGTEVRKLTAELDSCTRTSPIFCVDDGQQIMDTYPPPSPSPGDGVGCGSGGVGVSGGDSSIVIRVGSSGGVGVGGSDSSSGGVGVGSSGGVGDGGGVGINGGGSGSHSGIGGGVSGGRATVWWHAYKTTVPSSRSIHGEEERRFYRVSFHRRFRKTVLEEYLPHVIEKGREIIAKNRQRRLFTNDPAGGWSSAAFQHPATFNTLAMEPELKRTIIDELDTFKESKDYYTKVGKPWKRGYLLYGPPGTGKSTMICAMANHLGYDVYDLELTVVMTNSDLRRLFIDTTAKSILVVEDIDRSVDLTGGRSGDTNKLVNNTENDGTRALLTLSGLLNFIDGLWSACGGGERIIVFTTNNKDKLDPALIRPGRMDKQIEMSFCTYETFNMLATNYLQIDENHLYGQFGEIKLLLEKAKITPADVAEHLMREKDAGACLNGLVKTLKEKEKIAEAGQNEEEHD